MAEKDPSGLTWKWSSVKAGGMKPAPRSGVGLTTTATGLCYTFGGVLDVDEDEENVLGNFSSEMHSFDLAKQVWRLVELKEPAQSKATKKSKSADGEDAAMAADEPEAPTTAAAAKTVSDDGVFTMVLGGSSGGGGGMFGLGATTKAAPNVGNVPSPRMKASLVVCKKHLYLFGGIVEDGNKQFTLADFYSLGTFDG